MKKILIGLSAVVVVFLIVIVSINAMNKKEADRQWVKEASRQVKIDNCMKDAYDYYIENWNRACKTENKGDNCLLPLYRKEMLDESKANDEAICVERYK